MRTQAEINYFSNLNYHYPYKTDFINYIFECFDEDEIVAKQLLFSAFAFLLSQGEFNFIDEVMEICFLADKLIFIKYRKLFQTMLKTTHPYRDKFDSRVRFFNKCTALFEDI